MHKAHRSGPKPPKLLSEIASFFELFGRLCLAGFVLTIPIAIYYPIG